MNFIGLLRTLEAMTRPPRLGHDVDVEAQTECLVPEDFNAVCRCAACVAEEQASAVEYDDDPSPTIVQSAPPPTVDGEGSPADSGIPPSPAGERPRRVYRLGPDQRDAVWRHGDARLYRWQRQHSSWMWKSPLTEVNWRYCTLGGADIPSLDGVPFTEIDDPPAHPDDAAAEWIGEAVAVISAVLAEHNAKEDALERVVCRSQRGGSVAVFSDWQEWREHVAPLIANALAPQDK